MNPNKPSDPSIGPLLKQVLQGYLAHKQKSPPRTLQSDYAKGPVVAIGRRGVSLYVR